jgi:Second Messenger Oligonucleotide or Dinucleotide Synthetase domain
MKLHEHFSGLLDRVVNINPSRLEQLAQHEKALTEWLRGDSTFGPTVEGFIRQGSWAHRTIIRPLPGQEFDADLLVEMKPQRGWSKDPRRYPEALYDAMLRSPRHRGKVELKTRCVRVNYANDCHVDLVPYIHLPFYGIFDRHVIVNRTANEFEDVNPAGFAEWVRTRDRIANGHLRTTLRLLKYMRDYKGTFEVPSVILTVLVGNQVSRLLSWWDDRYRDLSTTFSALVLATDRWLQDHSYVPRIGDPSCPGVDFSHRLDKPSYREFRGRFNGYAGTVRAAYKAKDPEESSMLWRRVFGDEFASTAS